MRWERRREAVRPIGPPPIIAIGGVVVVDMLWVGLLEFVMYRMGMFSVGRSYSEFRRSQSDYVGLV